MMTPAARRMWNCFPAVASVLAVLLLLLTPSSSATNSTTTSTTYSNNFVVELDPAVVNPVATLNKIRDDTELFVVRKLMAEALPCHWLLVHRPSQKASGPSYGHYNIIVNEKLQKHPEVVWHSQQTIISRSTRSTTRTEDYTTSIQFQTEMSSRNPNFPFQWHLHNTIHKGSDINILPVWANGYTGKGTVVGVVDDGVEFTHKDLAANYDASCSYDWCENDEDPTPLFFDEQGQPYVKSHGTRCAGEIGAVNNDKCSIGVAYDCKLCALKVICGKDMADHVEAEALGHKPQQIDVYSSSWGPHDDGKTFGGPSELTKRALKYGAEKGRNNLGSIYVFAAGNGGKHGDNCNADAYVNSIYTMAITSIDEKLRVPSYTEACAVTFAATFSGAETRAADGVRPIRTTDTENGCLSPSSDRKIHSGTSAAAPIAAGIVAVMLSANPKLTRRDIAHIVAREAVKIPGHPMTTNSAGFSLHRKYGFGYLDASRLVAASLKWERPVPDMISRQTRAMKVGGTVIRKRHVFMLEVPQKMDRAINHLEYVQATLDFSSVSPRGALSLVLYHPRGMSTELLSPRPRDTESGPLNWTFASIRHWGESPSGTWKLVAKTSGGTARLDSWSLTFHGTAGEMLSNRDFNANNQPSTLMPTLLDRLTSPLFRLPVFPAISA